VVHWIINEAEAISDKEFPFLDKGVVRLVDYMGGDATGVQSARVSDGEGTKSYRENAGLINHVLHNRHISRFDQVVLTFR
jgi:thymidylate synthase (FAD)